MGSEMCIRDSGKSIYFKTRLAGRGERLDTIYVTKEDLEDKIHMDITYED